MRTWDFQPAVLLGFQPGWIELDIPGSSSIRPKGRCDQYHYYNLLYIIKIATEIHYIVTILSRILKMGSLIFGVFIFYS